MQNTTIAAGEQSKKTLFNGVIAAVIIILAAMTFVQAIELSRLRGAIQAAAPLQQGSGGQPQVSNPTPSVNAGLPAQVGGC